MKLIMKTADEKGGTGSSNNNPKIRIAVIGQHDVGKSALTVRYLTRRYIGEYKSNADLHYRQTLTASYGLYLDIEIVDVATATGRSFESQESVTASTSSKSFPGEELHKADAFVVVYSITDRKSFSFAQKILSALSSSSGCYPQHNNSNSSNQNTSTGGQAGKTCPFPIVLLANKNDLEHLRVVEKVEGVSLALKYGCQFHEISVAENSPELYQSFHTIISNFTNQLTEKSTSKRKFSVSKMLGNLRLGRTSPSQTQVMSQASIVHTSTLSEMGSFPSSSSSLDSVSPSLSSMGSSEESDGQQSQTCSCSCDSGSCHGNCHSEGGSNPPSVHQAPQSSNLSNSICNLKSKLAEFHSIRMRHNSPPICSL